MCNLNWINRANLCSQWRGTVGTYVWMHTGGSFEHKMHSNWRRCWLWAGGEPWETHIAPGISLWGFTSWGDARTLDDVLGLLEKECYMPSGLGLHIKHPRPKTQSKKCHDLNKPLKYWHYAWGGSFHAMKFCFIHKVANMLYKVTFRLCAYISQVQWHTHITPGDLLTGGLSQVWGQPGLYSDYQARQHYIARPAPITQIRTITLKHWMDKK